MKINDITLSERPREKMMARGAQALSDGELLAILLRSGSRRASALELSQMLLHDADGRLTVLAGESVSRLSSHPGIGPSKAVTVLAAFELGRRLIAEGNGTVRQQITDPETIYRLMIPRLKGLQHEECWVMYLDRAHHPLSSEMLSRGGGSATVIDNRMIVRRALELHADVLVLVHNHPSGSPRPGKADIEMTARLKKAANQFDIRLLDHVVVADSSYFSFADEEVTVVNAECGADAAGQALPAVADGVSDISTPSSLSSDSGTLPKASEN